MLWHTLFLFFVTLVYRRRLGHHRCYDDHTLRLFDREWVIIAVMMTIPSGYSKGLGHHRCYDDHSLRLFDRRLGYHRCYDDHSLRFIEAIRSSSPL